MQQVHYLHLTVGVTVSVLCCLRHRTDKEIKVRCELLVAPITKTAFNRKLHCVMHQTDWNMQLFLNEKAVMFYREPTVCLWDGHQCAWHGITCEMDTSVRGMVSHLRWIPMYMAWYHMWDGHQCTWHGITCEMDTRVHGMASHVRRTPVYMAWHHIQHEYNPQQQTCAAMSNSSHRCIRT
jgi:hypothetical protein